MTKQNDESLRDDNHSLIIIWIIIIIIVFCLCLCIYFIYKYFEKKLQNCHDDRNYEEQHVFQQRPNQTVIDEDVKEPLLFLQKQNGEQKYQQQQYPIQEQNEDNIENNFQFQQSNNSQQQFQQEQQVINVQDYLNIVQKLYDLSINKREVEEEFRAFVGPPLTQKKLIQYYADDNEQIEDQLKKQLKGFRRVRGDGNCFYTAFTYQYLELVLNIFDQRQFDEIIAHIRTMLFQMEYEEEFRIPLDAQNALAKCFADRLSELRKNPKEFFQQFSDPNNLLYGLSILFMRNLVNEIYLRNEMAQSIDGTLSKDFLYWEKECNLNELVIAFLAEELKLQINCYFVDSQKDQYKHDAYYEQGAHSIHLILQPGHYQIGLQK